MEEMDIEPCCWGNYSKYTDHKETLANLDENFAFNEEEVWTAKPSKWKKMKANIWRFLEDPGSSRWAKVGRKGQSSFILKWHACYTNDRSAVSDLQNKFSR